MNGDLHLLLRVLVAMACGFVIGWEREVRHQAAGDRTFGLVAGGAATLTAVSTAAFPNGGDRVVAGIVQGIGFIGAGLVLHSAELNQPRGLTTAAAVWATSAVGITAGLGHYWFAVGVTVLVVVLLEFRHLPLLRHLDARRWTSKFGGDDEAPQ